MAALFSAADLPEGRTGRWFALGITLAAPALLWIGLVSPLLEWHAQRAALLEHRLTVAQHMNAMVQALPQLRQQAAALSEGSNPATGAAGGASATLLDGATDAVAAAALQQKLQDMAARVGAEVASAETLPGAQTGAYRQIGLHVSLNTRWSVLIRLLQAIAQGSPRMLVDDLQVHSARVLVAGLDPSLTAAFTVLAYRADSPTAPAAPAPANTDSAAIPITLTGTAAAAGMAAR
jgi:general secretion pathway protein M